jgi:integrase/recombinase XerD
MLITEALQDFLISLEAFGDSKRTLATYDQRINLFREFVKRHKIEEITTGKIEKWIVQQRRAGLSQATIKGRFTALKTFLTWCVNRGYLATSPAAAIRIKRTPRRPGLKAAAPETIEQMIGAARKRAEEGRSRDLALLLFMVDTGCRAGEVASLKEVNLNLDKREAMVQGKTGPGMVYFTQRTAAALQMWLDSRAHENSHVFTGLRTPNKGNPITPGTVYQLLNRLANEAGVVGRHNPHSIRHLVGKRWVEETNLELARQKLRHADISTTALYANQEATQVKRLTESIKILE